MDNNELISVIMSTYNEELTWVKESVNSILKQTYNNLEFIIVLDNPNNVQLKILLEAYAEKDDRVILLTNKENIGLVKSLNYALKYCSGDYIARMDADDISDRNRLELQKEYLENNNLDFVFSGINAIDETGCFLYSTNTKKLTAEKIKKNLEITNTTYHPTWFLKTEIYKKMNGYREITYCEDYDFTLRCINNKYRIGKMDQNILKYRMRSNGISRTYSLEQFLNSKEINKLYTVNKLENFAYTKGKLNKIKNKINDIDKEIYLKSDQTFNSAVKLIKDRRLGIGGYKILVIFINDKYYRQKILNFLNYKFKNMY